MDSPDAVSQLMALSEATQDALTGSFMLSNVAGAGGNSTWAQFNDVDWGGRQAGDYNPSHLSPIQCMLACGRR